MYKGISMKILRRFICLTMAATFIFSINIQAETTTTSTPPEVAAIQKDIDALKKKQQDVDSQQSDTQNKLDQTNQAIDQTEAELKAIDDDLTKTTDDLLRVSDRLDEASASLDKMEQELRDAEKRQDEQYGALKQRLNFMYKNGKIGYLDIIFEAKSFPDFINRVEYINRIAKNDKTMLNKLSDTTDLVSETVDEIDLQKSTFEQLAAEQEQKQAELQGTLARKQDLFNRLDSDEKSYEAKMSMLSNTEDEIVALIKQKEKDQAAAIAKAKAEAEAKAKAKAEAEAAAKLAAQKAASGGGFAASYSTNSSPYSGRMLWPVPGHYMLSDTFRARYNPVNGRREFHTGIDIPVPTGSPILAADSGVVIRAGWVNGYGYTVIIDHGNGVSTLYGHNSRLVVSTGQYVEKGQQISRAGSTGNSTGPHCHFEIRVNGSAVNPSRYVM